MSLLASARAAQWSSTERWDWILEMPSSLLKAMKSLFSAGIVILVTILLCELALRVYNPIFIPLRANRIILPVNQTIVQQNPNNKKVDRKIVNTYNGLGLRGPEYPTNPGDYVKIFTIGGSTTACVTLNDGQTWPDRLFGRLKSQLKANIWLNNAGLNGHSTFGHRILLNSHIKTLQPDYILYLIGINDIGRKDLNRYDKAMTTEHSGLKQKFTAASELLSTLQVLYRSMKAFDAGVNHHYDMDFTELPTVEYSAADTEQALKEHREIYAQSYSMRVQQLITDTIAAGAQPILLTQPGLMGRGIDPTTGVELSTLSFHEETSALTQWQILEVYNNTLRKLAKENGVLLIDTAAKMPKDSKYYFDWIHYSKEGAQLMAEIIAESLVVALGADSK